MQRNPKSFSLALSVLLTRPLFQPLFNRWDEKRESGGLETCCVSNTPLSLQGFCECIAHLTQSQNLRQILLLRAEGIDGQFLGQMCAETVLSLASQWFKNGKFHAKSQFPSFPQRLGWILGWNRVTATSFSGAASLALSTASLCLLALNLVHFSRFYYLC